MDRRVTEASLAERPHIAGTHHPLAWTTGATGNPGAMKTASRLVEELSWRCDNLEPGEEATGSLKGQGCSRGCSWSQASVDLDLGSWANMKHLCLSDPRNNICSPELGLGVYSLLWEPGVGGHASPSSPAASGSASPQPPANWGLIPLPRVLSPGAPRGRQGAGGGAGGGAGLPGQPLQVHEGATHAHREGAPSRLQAECVPGVQAREGGPAGTSIRGDPPLPAHRGCTQKGCPPPGTGLAVGGARCPSSQATGPPAHRVRSCPAIPVALSGYVLVLCLPVGPWGQAAGCPLLPPRLTAAPPSLVPS